MKYEFSIVLLNDSVVTDRGRIDISDSVHSITFKESGKKMVYTPSDSKEIFRFTPQGVKISGVPTDTCWLFQTEIGRVNFFSCIAEPKTNLVTAIQISNQGAIRNLKKDDVLELVKAYPKLLRLAGKGKLVKALRGYNNLN